ncbi:MAG: N-6 DNA methylase [bacterium]|nr:N-6 DNA methylase [bacterium]
MAIGYERKVAIKKFVERWQKAEGHEDKEARSFWIELFHDVLGVSQPTRLLDFERRVRQRRIDVYCEEFGILIENKSRGVDLAVPRVTKKYGQETAYGQACWYRQYMAKNPLWIITCNFDEICIYDMHSGDSIPYEGQYAAKILLKELPDEYYLLEQLIDKSTSRLEVEKKLSVKATGLVGQLYDALMKQYKNIESDKKEQHDLNVLIVRLVFLFYAEDAGILQSYQAFLNFIKDLKPAKIRQALIELFKVLNTCPEERDPYLEKELGDFPYVNGGLFAEDIVIPQFDDGLARLLHEASAGFDWKDISPTIFGAAFESTLNPETRRSGGMHYTSVENIHRVIDPLFLNGLKAELASIEGEKTVNVRVRRLKAFRDKLAHLTFLDPACGSGNFLTETYLCLRRLENMALRDLLLEDEHRGKDKGDNLYLGDVGWQYGIEVSISQFYGIEINDFAVAVAKTALWIAEAQAKAETEELVGTGLNILPLANNDNIVVANALRLDWNSIIPKERLHYIVGNPPFAGRRYKSAAQQDDVRLFFKYKDIDYVACWFKKAALYMDNTAIEAALVATNSITQGEQRSALWHDLIEKYGININFAYSTFVWNSESLNKAAVYCVIIGFSQHHWQNKELYNPADDTVRKTDYISSALLAAPEIFLRNRSLPLCDVPLMVNGNSPLDGNALKIEPAEYAEFKDCPFVKRLMGGEEMLKNKRRYVLWLAGVEEKLWKQFPKVVERVALCREKRLTMGKDVQRLASKPALFRDTLNPDNYIALPILSSENRDYVPMVYLGSDVIPTNQLQCVPDAGLYHFGVLTSQVNMAWLRAVGGRFKGDYRYSKEIVYNNFPWPRPTAEQRACIEQTARDILAVRATYLSQQGKYTLDKLYKRGKMPADLLEAHLANDLAVEAAYGVSFGGDEQNIVEHLFNLYAQLTKAEACTEKDSI